MSDSTQSIARPVYRVVALQFTIAVLFSALVALFAGVDKGWSAALGGGIAVAGSLVYAMIVAKGSADAKQAFRSHARAEMVKVFITVVLFILALLLFQSAALLWLIVGFAVTTLAYWSALLAV
ncbi:ATP synthase subunit I [Massilia sp. SM-13]|uniref:ATP synthase subunit I n=1 Tax=Pseudoduganella rhizocola TaxID=3382643 RepID=UPI0038B4A198